MTKKIQDKTIIFYSIYYNIYLVFMLSMILAQNEDFESTSIEGGIELLGSWLLAIGFTRHLYIILTRMMYVHMSCNVQYLEQ